MTPRTPEQIAARFWLKTSREPNGCILWTGSLRPDGYGQFTVNGKRRTSAHRYAFEMAYGPVPSGLNVCHRCDRPTCVNPQHLFADTQKANCLDAVAKGRNVFGERHGRSKLTAALVGEARRIRSTEGQSYEAIAHRFGVAKKTMYDAINGTHWRSVERGAAWS